LRKRYEDSGYDGLLSGGAEFPGASGCRKAQAKQALDLYRKQYFDLNVRHFDEKLREEHRIGLGPERGRPKTGSIYLSFCPQSTQSLSGSPE